VILIGIETGPTVGSTDVNQVLGYFGLGAGTVLAFPVVAGIIRDSET